MTRPRTLIPPLAALALLLHPLAGAAAEGPAPVTTVARVDLARYAGRWYEIARIPNRFQRQCVRGTTAEYALCEDGKIDVTNRCTVADGSVDEARGRARVVDPVSRARLEVSFVSFLGWRPFWGDYWVIGLDEDYRWAVVGEPGRDYGWILARTPTVDAATMARVMAVLERNGYEPERFVESLPPD